jgi:type I restriction enzyme S subunit
MICDLKRYPAMKDSGVPWLGEVPEHWDVRRLGAVLRERGETNDDNDMTDVLSVMRERGVIPYAEKGNVGNKKSDDITRYKIVRPDDIVVNCMNVIIGSVGLSKYTGCLSPVYYVLTRRSEVDDPRYLNAYFQTKPFQLSLVRIGNGILSHRMRIPMELLKCEPFPRPPAIEQAAIVRFVDYMDRRIRKYIRAKQKLIKLLEEQKEAIIHRAVTRGLDPNVRLKPSGVEWLGDVPEHWEVRKIKAYVDVRDGTHDTPAYVEPDEKTFPLLTSRNIYEGRVSLESAPHITKDDYEAIARRSFVAKGDIVMPMIGTIGNPCVVDTDRSFAIKNVALFRTSVSTRILPDYLCCLLKSNAVAKQMEDLSRGGVQGFVGLNTLRNLYIALPSLNEQRTILQYLIDATHSCSDAIAIAHREIALLREYRTRLIADVVTGKLDVREASAQLPAETDEPEPVDEMDAIGNGGEETADNFNTEHTEVEA